MTPEQHERWKDFALRMATTYYKGQRRPGRKWIVEQVQDFLDGICAEDIPCIRDWDSAEPYPSGTRFYRRSLRCSCWHCKDRKKGPCPYACEGGLIYDYARPYPPCDMFSEWETDCIYCNFHDLASRAEIAKRDSLDGEQDDDFMDVWTDRWSRPISACVRAGLDVAVAPSAGVAGLTAGDVRRMWPEGVPSWVKDFFSGGELFTVESVIPGVGFVPKVVGPAPATFDEMPDDLEVWL